MNGDSPEGIEVLDKLAADGLVEPFDYDRVLHQAARSSERVEEVLLEIGVVTEADLLRTVAEMVRTQFVATDKLAKAQVGRTLIEMVPRRLAERLGAFPIIFDRKTLTLSVVTYDLQVVEVARQLQAATDARTITTYVARPGAVRAAIRKYYYGEVDSFTELMRPRRRRQADPPAQPAATRGDYIDVDFGSDELSDRSYAGASRGRAQPARRTPEPAPAPPPPAAPAAPAVMEIADASLMAALSGSPLSAGTSAADAPSSSHAARASAGAEAAGSAASGSPAASSSLSVSPRMFLESLNVMVTLVEQERAELRGHTSLVARLTRKLCELVDMPREHAFEVVVAAYLHDLGKAGNYHLTPLNVAQYEGHRVQAQKSYAAPIRLFESAGLGDKTVKTLNHLYERYDGNGFPDRLQERDIPLGSRVLAVVETYADITASSKNPFRRRLSPREACEAIQGLVGTVFDPTIVQLLQRLAVGDEVRQQLLDDAHTVLLLDPDVESTTVLEMRLMEHGHRVLIARSFDQALNILAENEVDLLLTEVDLPTHDGFRFVERCRAGSQPDTPVIFLTRRGDRESVQRGVELAAADYMVKPASPEVVAMKVGQVLSQTRRGRSHGVSGSLREMSLPDVVQILSNGRKSGKLTLTSSVGGGELHFGGGAICDARFGDLGGADAVYALLSLTDGEFALDPSFLPLRNTINLPTESLLLEGMRRLDEGGR
jgi:response regulator RpfG family c-di-GMP phosphodiesterase